MSDIIVIGTSAGGVQALSSLIKDLPANLNATILIVMHTSTQSSHFLHELLQNRTRLVVVNPRDGQVIRRRHIYIAPPNQHMIIDKGGYIRLTYGPRVNHCRPAIDPLFRSAAIHYGTRVIGVLLTGMLDDGVAGLELIKARRGTLIVQDPEDAQYPEMPSSALAKVKADYCLPLAHIAPLLIELTTKTLISKAKPASKSMKIETRASADGLTRDVELDQLGTPSGFTCPECHGALWEVKTESNSHYRCRIGHSYGSQNLLAVHDEETENILWSAVRALEENAALTRHLVETYLGKESDPGVLKFFNEKAKLAESNATKIKALLLKTKVEKK